MIKILIQCLTLFILKFNQYTETQRNDMKKDNNIRYYYNISRLNTSISPRIFR